MDKAKPKRILIVLLGAIGDVTRALPLAVRIKKFWPDVELCWAVEQASSSLLLSHKEIDQVFIFDRKKGIAGYCSFIKEIRQNNFDVALDLQRLFKSGLTSYLSRAPIRIGFSLKNSRELNWLFQNRFIENVTKFTSKIQHYQKFGDLLELPIVEPLEFGFEVSSSSLQKVNSIVEQNSKDLTERKEKLVALILGSTWESRFWLVEYYVSLINELHQKLGFRSLLVGAKSELDFSRQIVAQVNASKVVDLVGKTELNDLIALFSSVRLAIGSDSGPMHIAAGVGCPVVSLWGATSPLRSAPYGSENFVLQSGISCSPCYRKVCPGLGKLCMKEITPEVVLARVEQIVLDQDKQRFGNFV